MKYDVLFIIKPIVVDGTDKDSQTIIDKATHSEIPEMRIIDNSEVHQAQVEDKKALERYKSLLEGLGYKVSIIGCWSCRTDLQQGYMYNDNKDVVRIEDEEEKEIYYPFSFDKYFLFLNDVIEYDDEDNETTRRPTIEEGRQTQVNRYAGQPPRDLNSYLL